VVFSAGSGVFRKTRITPSPSKLCLTGSRTNLTCSTDSDCPGALVSDSGQLLACRLASGVVGVAEEFQGSGRDAYNLHMDDTDKNGHTRPGDIIVLPKTSTD